MAFTASLIIVVLLLSIISLILVFIYDVLFDLIKTGVQRGSFGRMSKKPKVNVFKYRYSQHIKDRKIWATSTWNRGKVC